MIKMCIEFGAQIDLKQVKLKWRKPRYLQISEWYEKEMSR